MDNPFELIMDKLNSIEDLLKTLLKNDKVEVPVTEILNLNQAAEHLSITKSTLYKKTSERSIPHFKQGKRLYFKRNELDTWLTEQKVKTISELEREANDYIMKKGKFK